MSRKRKGSPANLADRIYEESFRNSDWRRGGVHTIIRQNIKDAIRITLDPNYSRFLCDLTFAAFEKAMRKTGFDNIDSLVARNPELLDQWRRLAKAPFKKTWVEFDNAIFQARRRELLNLPTPLPAPPDQFLLPGLGKETIRNPVDRQPQAPEPSRIGFYIEELTEEVYKATPCGMFKDQIVYFPISHIWTSLESFDLRTLDGEVPLDYVGSHSLYCLGLEYPTKNLLVVKTFPDKEANVPFLVVGLLRSLWLFLGSLADVPKILQDRRSKGYIRRQYVPKDEEYLPYRLVRLNIPAERFTNAHAIARRICAHVRHREHTVRRHLRHYRDGKAVWVKEHKRGDPSLGSTTYEYLITRKDCSESSAIASP
jgi:hypothetical protein